MSDYCIGKGSSKDRYMVGWNKSSSNIYKVGGAGMKVSDSNNQSLGGGQLDPVVGSKSAFDYKEVDPKDIGDESESMNFGGAVSMGTMEAPDSPLIYTQKGGDLEGSLSAMARRKAIRDAAKDYMTKEFDTPVDQIMDVKKG